MAGYSDQVISQTIELVKAAVGSNAALAIDAETLVKTLDTIAKKVHSLHYIVQPEASQR